MNHQPFEEWMLSDEPLDAEQDAALTQHLVSCPDCPPLARAWQAVRQEIATEPPEAPAPGFSMRWQARLKERRAEQQRRTVLLTVGLNALALLVTGAVWLVPQIGHVTLTGILVTVLGDVTLLAVRINQAMGAVSFLFRDFSGGFPSDWMDLLPVALLAVGATTLALLSVVWVFTMWKIIVPKGAKE
jgi:hypothetical protein